MSRFGTERLLYTDNVLVDFNLGQVVPERYLALVQTGGTIGRPHTINALDLAPEPIQQQDDALPRRNVPGQLSVTAHEIENVDESCRFLSSNTTVAHATRTTL